MANSAGLEIAKAGWLHRRSTVLHRWKKNWFVLYRDGVLRYFESPDSARAEEVYVLRTACSRVKTGPEVEPVQPPEGVSSAKACLFELEMRDGQHLILCAESMDDMKAWQYALEEARTIEVPSVRNVPITFAAGHVYSPYMSYGGYPGHVINTAGTVISPPGTTQVIRTPNGTTTVINPVPATQVVYMDDYPYRRRYYYGPGTGLLAGAMLGSAMMYPYYWW